MTITERHPDGRIKKKSLSSEEAARIGKKGYSVKKANSTDQLLIEAGHEPGEAPEHLRILAKQALSSTPAMKAFLQLTRTAEESGDLAVAIPGEQCPTCRQWVLADMQMTEVEIGEMLESVG